MIILLMLPPYPRGRFGGRHPLCGIGVVSSIPVIVSPAKASARIAASRPCPGPLTLTSTVLSPCSTATFAAASPKLCGPCSAFYYLCTNLCARSTTPADGAVFIVKAHTIVLLEVE